VDAARALVVLGGHEQVLHAARQLLRPHAQGRLQPREQPVVDPKGDAAAASGGENALGGQAHGVRERDVGAAVDG
jgi:hypothetical protein